MELSDAVEKAADEAVMPLLSMAMTPDGPKIMDLDTNFEGKHNYEYLQELKPLVSKWGDIVGEAIATKAGELGEFESEGIHTKRDDIREVTDEFKVIYESKGVDIACGIFALGYLLGDPVWDSQKHDRKTFHSALADRDTHRILHSRFMAEGFLRERFDTLIDAGSRVISNAFSQMNIPHTKTNVHEWGKLSVIICYYEAFQVGLRSRRIWEEDMTFNQIARGLED